MGLQAAYINIFHTLPKLLGLLRIYACSSLTGIHFSVTVSCTMAYFNKFHTFVWCRKAGKYVYIPLYFKNLLKIGNYLLLNDS